ncbi:2-phospho-L-lactate guanylyltransferase [Novosphingobium soli]|uniref:2-phospho-L-lactate guanylyltransferase n=1 Tax=Novosphingobium soli TaxID=574956 RepID=A0ABV6CW16_9SPHN
MTQRPATWALIPVKARGAGKSRLAAALDPEERARLVDAMLAHVVLAAEGAVSRTLLLGPERGACALERVEDAGGGLNAALDAAFAALCGRSDAPARLVVLAADLPQVSVQDIARLARLPAGTLGIAPDRHGTGTNALSLPLPEAAGFRFHYGVHSAARHREVAESLGLNAVTITGPGLEKDIDEPADLADAQHMFSLVT